MRVALVFASRLRCEFFFVFRLVIFLFILYCVECIVNLIEEFKKKRRKKKTRENYSPISKRKILFEECVEQRDPGKDHL